MAKRYFYTDALKAAWMMKEFAIQIGIYEPSMGIIKQTKDAIFCGGDEFIDFQARDVVYGLYEDACLDKYYIHPDCHEMLKAQLFDIVKVDDAYLHVVSGDKEINECVFLARRSKGKPQCYNVWAASEIIQRNGKAWFMPEVEGN